MSLTQEEIANYHHLVESAVARHHLNAPTDAPWASASPSVRSVSPRGSMQEFIGGGAGGTSAFASFPTLQQLHQNVRHRIAQQRIATSPHDSEYDHRIVAESQALPTPSTQRPPPSTLEMIQGIILSSKRSPLPTGRDIPLLPPELYELGGNRSVQGQARGASPPTSAAPHVGPTYSCAGCASLERKVSDLQRSVDVLMQNQQRWVHALAHQLRLESTGASSSHEVQEERAPPAGDAQTELTKMMESIAVDLDFVVAAINSRSIFGPAIASSTSGGRHESIATEAVPDSAVMQLLIQVGERIGQVESDLDTTVQETQKLEDRIVQRLHQIEDGTVKSSDLNSAIGEWFRVERNEALQLVRNLYRAMGVAEEAVEQCTRPSIPASGGNVPAGSRKGADGQVVADIEALWRGSNIARSLQFLHTASMKPKQKFGTQGYGEEDVVEAHNPLSMDAVGLLPLPARMLGLQLVDEPFSKGPRVGGILPGSSASGSALTAGSTIVAINRMPVRTVADVIAALTVVMPGSHVRVDSVSSKGIGDVAQLVAGSQRVYA